LSGADALVGIFLPERQSAAVGGALHKRARGILKAVAATKPLAFDLMM